MKAAAARPARGMTLIIVLWVVAALTILVAGLVRAQHSEWRLVGAARSQLGAVASGRAAIQRAAQEMAGSPQAVGRLMRRTVREAGQDIELEVMPLVGLVDLNSAPEVLLQALLQHAGGLPEASARALAAAAVERRQATAAMPGRATRFEVPEELLALPGVDHDLFARIAPLMTTDSAGGGRVNPLAAPFPVLLVLASGDAGLAQRIAGERDAGSVVIDTTRLESAYIDATVSSRYRITAHVPTTDGRRWTVEQELDLHSSDPGGPPWRTLRTASRRSLEMNGAHVSR